MSTAVTTVALSAPGTPPREFIIFRAGDNETEKGVFRFDADAQAAVLAHAAKRNMEFAIDYAHGMLLGASAPDPAQSGKAAGWFRLSVRDGELWAVNVRWTEPAHAALSRGEFRYTSPAFEFDPDTRRVTALLNVALTNVPATHGLDPLTTLSRAPETVTLSAEDRAVARALGVTEAAMLAQKRTSTTTTTTPRASTSTATLSDDEQRVCAQLGLDPGTMLATKRATL